MKICEKLNLGGKNVLGKWVYGDLIRTKKLTFICVPKSNTGTTNYNIEDIETIGQFTGLHDANGQEIYEGDILDFDYERWVVSYENGKFIGTFDNVRYDLEELTDFGVIGNIHEDMYLLYGDEGE